MFKGVLGKFGGIITSVAHSLASVGKSSLEGLGLLEKAGVPVEPSVFESVFDQFEGLPPLREDIYGQPSDQLIPGRLHKESGFAPKGKFYYSVFSDYINPEGDPESAILTIRSDTRMSLDEILASTALPACSMETVGDPEEMEWELIEAYVGV